MIFFFIFLQHSKNTLPPIIHQFYRNNFVPVYKISRTLKYSPKLKPTLTFFPSKSLTLHFEKFVPVSPQKNVFKKERQQKLHA